MTHNEFHAILSEAGYKDVDIEELWGARPTDDLKPTLVKETAAKMLEFWRSN